MNSDEIKVLYKVGCKYNFFYTKKVEGVNKKRRGGRISVPSWIVLVLPITG